MLCRLTIRDFVLVDRLELEFKAGFGALTGETGAGKSILVDALAFALGERADAGLVRAGGERAEVSAEFAIDHCPATTEWLRAHDLEGEGGLLLRRLVDANGRSRAYVNGSPVTVLQLREVAESLVDIHGQHAHQSLMRGEAQRALLDSHARLDRLAIEVGAAWREWHDTRAMFETATNGLEALSAEREQLSWQLAELTALAFSSEEWCKLNEEHKRLAHATSLVEGAQYSLQELAEGESACASRIGAVGSRLHALAEYDPALSEVAALLQSAQAELSEAVSALRRYADRTEIDPQRLVELERRIDAVLSCARKFRASPDELPRLLQRWQERLATLGETADLTALAERVTVARERYEDRARELSRKRHDAAAALGREVSQVMQQLALSGGRFEVGLIPVDGGNAFGFEQIEFRLATASGGDSRSLAKVASGGELSRVSLAIQVVTSQAASVPTLIFDEVDVGIGGGVAEIVGRLLRSLGVERQVLCVTHLPQVAARANWQWLVSKRVAAGQVRSQVSALEGVARVEEIARMLGGVEITDITRRHAQEMLAGT